MGAAIMARCTAFVNRHPGNGAAIAHAPAGVARSARRGYAICACAASTSARTASVSSAFSSVKAGVVFTE